MWLASSVLFWGFIATIQAAVTSWGGLMTCRVFLGIAEACFGPGVPLYLTYFYPRDRIAFRHGIFISGSAAANAYGSALAYGISQAKGSIASWKVWRLARVSSIAYIADPVHCRRPPNMLHSHHLLVLRPR